MSRGELNISMCGLWQERENSKLDLLSKLEHIGTIATVSSLDSKVKRNPLNKQK